MKGLAAAVAAAAPQRVGTVTSVLGLGLEVAGLDCAVGELLTVGSGAEALDAEVVASVLGGVRCMPLGRLTGIAAGAPARASGRPVMVPTGAGLFGRVLDGMGRPFDGKGPLDCSHFVPLDQEAPNPMLRARIDTPLQTGVRVLDTLTTLGRGQRIGLFAGSGVGKSSLLSMLARGTDAQVSVIALVGERGREVREFLEDDLGPEGLARSVVVVATSDEPALMRLRAAVTATRIAESFRESGQDVVLMMDSLTRVAMAQREIGLSAGEPPATRGYPPSTFSVLARLLERAGTAETGSITGIYTVLVDGDDHNEPIADAARSILDGHVVLDRKLAVTGHFPSVDVLGSVSRVASKVTDPVHTACAVQLRRVLAARRAAQDLIDVGAYRRGSNPLVDAALDNEAAINQFLRQGMGEPSAMAESWAWLSRLSTRFDVEGAA
ncbi:FliI/YscN family ATPase [Arthrobacter sp. TES]|uniref:FliI/YscN family ATPase n=1 Tax=Paenarthrobacter ureafaciens TaxID=37931 RepID=UPI00039669C0|nr:FliI/YscN family ATPase [Paenarthrobacter ureafaciens]AOY72578.1 ATP synthase [Arthrobacter sp. ZXY-2]ERI36302.1 ATP synthase [Arthrobacter sp. AK-YN10]QOI64222.1 FliI/YscN family ATPase [Arthrobacter sp. TES]GLU69829.1 EscN/YscN/HrcN family type III secretion system ATPase [Paenarthrobacter ureafaciens]GLU74029.1 EscN/YscN/HrcN family type III secretion system ATPase [Paenarthrobacter ureafaciens]